MWPELESNQRHKDFQSSALPTELSGLVRRTTIYQPADLRQREMTEKSQQGIFSRGKRSATNSPLNGY